jgi:dual-specificity kinase
MSLISNRKRPRGFSETFASNKNTTKDVGIAPSSSATVSSTNSKTLHLDYDMSENSMSSSSITNSSPPPALINPFKSAHSASTLMSSKRNNSRNVYLIDEDDDDIETEQVFIDEPIDDDDVVILEERELIQPKRNNSDSLLILDHDAFAAYNMFNVNNTQTNPFEIEFNKANPIKKQRTNSLPQLPQAKCFYNKIPNNYILQTPKLGNIKTNVIPHQLNLPPCDDENGHYVIHPDEPFANRFVIVRLLGQGTFGKVVKCVDKITRENVAIKIIRNIQKYRDAAKIELRILSTLKNFDNENLNHCIHLRECFDYRGHICIVTDLLKISLYDFMENNKFIAFPGSHIQAVLKQLIRSVTFLHDLNLIHTDLKPENILLHEDDFIKKHLQSTTLIASYLNLSTFQEKEGTAKKAPRYLRILKNPLIQIIDFGSAIFNDEYHSSIVSTRHYRAPEIVLGIGWSFPCDMWSIGCILVELVIGEPLFRTHDNLEHLAMIEKVCGYKIDKKLVMMSKQKENECGLEYFTEQYVSNSPVDHSFESDVDEDRSSDEEDDDVIIDDESTILHLLTLKFPTRKTPSKFIKSVSQLSRIDIFVSNRVGLEINFDYSLLFNYQKNKHLINFGNFTFWWFFIDLLRKLFVIDPEERLIAVDALNHPWFNLGIEDEGTL